MADLMPITVWSLGSSPSPWKVNIILEELRVPYKVKRVGMAEVKQEPYISLNPNGRVPTIEDPNTGMTLWESGAIVEYLIETYDKSFALSYNRGSPESHHCHSWAYFQCSGQGPYFGQLGWFNHLHTEKLPSATERHTKEVVRVNSVIDLHLGKTKTEYLVGDKCTYADLMFVPYTRSLAIAIATEIDTNVHKRYSEWVERLYERPAVKKVFKSWDEAIVLTNGEAQWSACPDGCFGWTRKPLLHL